jgi:hypothetical protein
VPIPIDETKYRKNEARKKAIRRKSFKCPVYIAARTVLEKEQPMDSQHAVEIIECELRNMPEAAATLDLIGKIKRVECGE